jgi:hypothetical protein
VRAAFLTTTEKGEHRHRALSPTAMLALFAEPADHQRDRDQLRAQQRRPANRRVEPHQNENPEQEGLCPS